eukprot:7259574-Heterocapsa_arctica.AAC.1
MFEDLENKVYANKLDKIYRTHKSNKPHKEEDIVECIMAIGFISQNTDNSYSGHAYSREDKHTDQTANGRKKIRANNGRLHELKTQTCSNK